MVVWREQAPQIFKTATLAKLAQGSYLKTVGDRQRKTLDEYTGGTSLWFNNYLRGIRLNELNPEFCAELKNKVAVLNTMISDAPRSKKNMVVFRAIAQNAPSRGFQKYARGDDADFLSKGLVSTSVSAETAWGFLENDETCCFLVLLLPKGTKMLEVMGSSVFENEDEILLPHGSKFKVTSTATIEGIRTFYCTLVAQPKYEG